MKYLLIYIIPLWGFTIYTSEIPFPERMNKLMHQSRDIHYRVGATQRFLPYITADSPKFAAISDTQAEAALFFRDLDNLLIKIETNNDLDDLFYLELTELEERCEALYGVIRENLRVS